MPPTLVIRAALITAAALAWLLVRRAPQHRPAAVALSALAALDVVRPLAVGHIPPIVNGALFLSAYAVQAGLAVRVFLPSPPRLWWLWCPVVGWAVATVALRLWWSPRVETVAFAASAATQVGAALAYALRRPRELPSTQHGVAILLAVSALADVAGPWWHGAPRAEWSEGAWTALLTWAMIAAWEVWRWAALSLRRSS